MYSSAATSAVEVLYEEESVGTSESEGESG